MADKFASFFGRAYQVTLQPLTTKQGGLATKYTYGSRTNTNEAIRCSFEVSKGLVSGANTAKVTLYNIAPIVRESLAMGWEVTIQAGYQGIFSILFRGIIQKTKSHRDGPDIVTDMECLDGGNVLNYMTVSKTYPKGTSWIAVVQDVASYFNVHVGTVLGLPKATFPRGITVHGQCSQIIQRLCHPYRLEFSIQDGLLTILPKDAHLGTMAIVLNKDTGLLGIPSVTLTGIEFEALLNPYLKAGQIVLLQSKNKLSDGYCKIRGVKFQGDTFGEKWTAACSAFAMPKGSVQTLKAAQGFNFETAVI